MIGLTGVGSRRAFDDKLDVEWRRCAREQRPVSLILADVYHFKQYNDTYGHIAGDECLKQVAQVIDGAVGRPGDLVARYGGEEFAVILRGQDAAGAFETAERLRRSLSDKRFSVAGQRLPVTVSIGVATLEQPSTGRDGELMCSADRRLYQAKALGRNRSVGESER